MSKPAIGGLVILDGPDAVGKTTLAKKLLDGDEGGYIHLTYDSTWFNPNHELWKIQYLSLVRATLRSSIGRLTVIDRHWMSEQIYARIYRGGSDLNAECRQWDQTVQKLGGVYVICAPTVDSAFFRHAVMHDQRREMYEPSKQISAVAQAFRDLWYGSPNCEVVDYVTDLMRNGGMQVRDDAMLYDIDVHGDNLKNVCEVIRERLRTLKTIRQLRDILE